MRIDSRFALRHMAFSFRYRLAPCLKRGIFLFKKGGIMMPEGTEEFVDNMLRMALDKCKKYRDSVRYRRSYYYWQGRRDALRAIKKYGK